jgi:hypothetical protein
VLGRFSPPFAFIIREKAFQSLTAVTERPSFFNDTVTISIPGMHTVQNIICKRCNDHVYFEPIVNTFVLLFVECADFLVFNSFKLQDLISVRITVFVCCSLTLSSLFRNFSKASWSTASMSFFFMSAVRWSCMVYWIASRNLWRGFSGLIDPYAASTSARS